MYPDGPAQLVEGWTKNLASGAASIGLRRTALVAVWITAALTALISLTEHLGGAALLPVPVAVGWYLAFVGQFFVQLRALGNFGRWPALAYPLLLVVFAAIFFRSLWFTLVRHRVEWRGRSIPVAAPVGRTPRAHS
jgi:4,4'-diaponeurosporenoate glycosyltransferase